jgi:hypothetical protein
MRRVRIEIGLAAIAAVLALVTFVWPTWIELLSGLEPDGGNGEAEWWLAFVFAAVSGVSILLARRDYRAVHGRGAVPESS